MHHLITYLLPLAFLLCRHARADDTNQFINPPLPGPTNQYGANNVYAIGSVINLQWRTNFTTMSLVLWQNDNSTFQYLEKEVPATSTLAWNVNLTGVYSLDQGNVFFLMIFDEGSSSGDRFSSHYFNISDNGAASSTTATLLATTSSSSSQSTSSTFAASTTSSTSATAVVAPPSQSTPAASNIGLSAVKIGVGVGVGVGLLCLFAGIGVGWFVWRRRGKGQNKRQDPSEAYSEAFLQPYHEPSKQALPEPTSELDGATPHDPKKLGRFVELPSQSYVPELGTSRQ